MYHLGLDIGSSSVKAALVDATTGKKIAVVIEPENEMTITALRTNWAEQAPEMWWENVCAATKKVIKKANVDASKIAGIGIAYQMHGMVVVDKKKEVLRPSIIWCDSRAVEIGNMAFKNAGADKCISNLLNSPGNFTLSKLKWVKENEPELFAKVDKVLLPGDFIALKLTGETTTTISGLSEGIMWDFKQNKPADWLFDHLGISTGVIPDIVPTFSQQGRVSKKASAEIGLPEGTPVLYRSGDQPNNALSLNVFEPGEIAATGGTSGVVYAVTDSTKTRESLRINNFAHVNYTKEKPRIGKLLNINGAGIHYSWMKQNILSKADSYEDMNAFAATVPVGSDGVRILPFGNGAERILNNQYKGASISNLNFNTHSRAHLLRASLEGIAFSFVYGIDILIKDGVDLATIKAGNDNLFRSEIFSNTIATLVGTDILIKDTTGAVGAARAAGVSAGGFRTLREAFSGDENVMAYHPLKDKQSYVDAYELWKEALEKEYNQ